MLLHVTDNDEFVILSLSDWEASWADSPPKVKNISFSVWDVSGQDKVWIKPFCLGDITFDMIQLLLLISCMYYNMKFNTQLLILMDENVADYTFKVIRY